MAEQTDYVETNYILIDLNKAGALQDQRVRCALSMAIDRKEIIDKMLLGFGAEMTGPFTPRVKPKSSALTTSFFKTATA